jgi:pimeloyl-ACP methyl ester carboxylesterase
MEPAESHPIVRSLGTGLLQRDSLMLSSTFAAPASATEQRLLPIWAAVTNIEGLGVEDDFFELGGDSLMVATLFAQMEQAFGKMPPLSSLLKYSTIRKLAGRFDELRVSSNESQLIPIRAQGRRPALFYLHAAHGNVVYVRKLLPYLHPEQPLYAIQARGLQEGETPHRDFASMAADYVAQIRKAQPAGPYFLAGNCVGALIAFEMAQYLRAAGESVAGLIIVDPDIHPNAAPWLHWRNYKAPHVRIWRRLVSTVWWVEKWINIVRLVASGYRRGPGAFETGENRQRQAAILAGLREALDGYRPGTYDGGVLVIGSAWAMKYLRNRATGWPAIAPRAEFVQVGNSHGDMLNAAFPEVARTLSEYLDRPQPAADESGVAAVAE